MSFRESLSGVPGEGEVASCECLVSEVVEQEEACLVMWLISIPSSTEQFHFMSPPKLLIFWCFLFCNIIILTLSLIVVATCTLPLIESPSLALPSW